jgi:hypothetical protein
VPNWLLLAIAVPAVAAIFATTPAGHRLLARLGIRLRFGGGPAPEDHSYLLRVCGGDPRELERRLANQRERWPELSEAELYRKAIRAHLRGPDSEGQQSGS